MTTSERIYAEEAADASAETVVDDAAILDRMVEERCIRQRVPAPTAGIQSEPPVHGGSRLATAAAPQRAAYLASKGYMSQSGPNANLTRPKLSPIVKRSAPYETAEIVLREIYPREERLIHYRDNFYQWIGNHYREVETGETRSRLYGFLNGAIVLTQAGEPRPFCPDKPKVDKVMDALKARTRIDNGLQAPAYDRRRSADSEQTQRS